MAQGKCRLIACHQQPNLSPIHHHCSTLFKNYVNGRALDGSLPTLSKYAVPEADINEILIEKTPEIINGDYEQLKARAIMMKETMKGVKLLVMFSVIT